MPTIEAETVDELDVSALDFEPEQECDHSEPCQRPATWRVTCTKSGCWGMMCDHHTRLTYARQEAEAKRRGMVCSTCSKTALRILRFDPIIFPGESRLW